MAELSIIIPTYNSMGSKKKGLELVLASVLNQDIDKNTIEIVFIDNGSSDDTIPFLEKWTYLNSRNFSNLQLGMNPDRLNRSRSRNMGVEIARGKNILFMDDDTMIYNRKTLKILLESYFEKQAFFCGAPRYWTRAGWNYNLITDKIKNEENIDSFAFLPGGIARETGYRDLQEFSFIGNFGGLKKDDFIKTGGFDEVRFPARQEDVDLMYRLLLNGFSFRKLDDKLKVIHLNHPIIGNKKDERLFWFNEFRKKEHESGYYFCINHLFGVFEDYSGCYPVLKKIE